jgi:hypothetical protein
MSPFLKLRLQSLKKEIRRLAKRKRLSIRETLIAEERTDLIEQKRVADQVREERRHNRAQCWVYSWRMRGAVEGAA